MPEPKLRLRDELGSSVFELLFDVAVEGISGL
jgi:hypothetical protein